MTNYTLNRPSRLIVTPFCIAIAVLTVACEPTNDCPNPNHTRQENGECYPVTNPPQGNLFTPTPTANLGNNVVTLAEIIEATNDVPAAGHLYY